MPNIKGIYASTLGWPEARGAFICARNYSQSVADGTWGEINVSAGGHAHAPTSYGSNQNVATSFNANLYDKIYTQGHHDVTPYNFNINIYAKV